jgi:hypothetical protein
MDPFSKRLRILREIKPDYTFGAPRVKVRLTKPIPRAAQHISTVPPDNLRQTPATPLMLTPTLAWRRLCARTGGGVTIQCFYRWIGNGSLYSVRLGKRIFVPIDKVDALIENCLAGEDLKSFSG